jgi:MFS family permease
MTTAIGAHSASEIDGAYAWRRLAVSTLLSTLGGAGMWAVVVVLPAVQAEFGVDRGDASLPYTLTMIGFALGNLLVGRLIDRFGFMWPGIVAALVMGLGFFLAALTTSVTQFALVQGVLIGAGSSATFGPLIADISHWFDRRRGVAVGVAASGNYLAGAVWPIAMQGFLVSDGWRTTYVGIGVICIAAMVPLLFLLRRRLPEDSHGHAPGAGSQARVQPISLTPPMLQALLVVAGVACCVAMSMPQVHIVAYCGDLGYGVGRGAEMLSLMLGFGIISRIGSGFLADKIGGIRTLLIGSVAQGTALLFYLFFDGLTSLYIISAMFGLFQGGIVPSYAIIVREAMPASQAATRVGIVIFASVFGMSFGGWISGAIFDATGSYSAAFANGLAWNALNITVILLLLMRARQRLAMA